MLKTDKVHKYLLLGKSWLHSESFYMPNCENKSMSAKIREAKS